jgi:zinc transport system substrate-binding protein
MKRFVLLVLGFVLAAAAPAQAKMLVAVSIAPQAYFLKQIAGDRVDALVMVPPGTDAHTYEPKPRQLAELGKAAAYFGIGMDFENAWLPRFQAANPKMAIVATDAGIEKMPMVAHDHEHEHEAAGQAQEKAEDAHYCGGNDKAALPQEQHPEEHHEAGEEHHHAGEPDPHIWLSPRLAKVIAANMRDGLIKADPAGAADYKAGYERFVASCDALDAAIKKAFAGLPPGEHVFMVFHPSWGYFARDYGLTQEPIEQLGREPGPKALASLVKEAKKDNVKVIFVQPQMSARQAETIAQAIGGSVAPLDPLAADWADNLTKAAGAIRQGMAGASEAK